MALCPYCNLSYKEPEDEQGDHPCPKCTNSYIWMPDGDSYVMDVEE